MLSQMAGFPSSSGWIIFHYYEVCAEGVQPCNMKNRDICWRIYKTQETLYIGQWHPVPFKVGTLGLHTVLPITIGYPFIFFWISSTVWTLFPLKGDFSFVKSQKSQGTKFRLWEGWLTWVIWCFTKKLHKTWCVSGYIVIMMLPITSCP